MMCHFTLIFDDGWIRLHEFRNCSYQQDLHSIEIHSLITCLSTLPNISYHITIQLKTYCTLPISRVKNSFLITNIISDFKWTNIVLLSKLPVLHIEQQTMDILHLPKTIKLLGRVWSNTEYNNVLCYLYVTVTHFV